MKRKRDTKEFKKDQLKQEKKGSERRKDPEERLADFQRQEIGDDGAGQGNWYGKNNCKKKADIPEVGKQLDFENAFQRKNEKKVDKKQGHVRWIFVTGLFGEALNI